ncbi:MAG TPA: SpoIIE family protein phosphatase [Acidobacteriota bacterium]|nr:SpoIIE family protein phosphatase [Acidobacteriota bacterium]
MAGGRIRNAVLTVTYLWLLIAVGFVVERFASWQHEGWAGFWYVPRMGEEFKGRMVFTKPGVVSNVFSGGPAEIAGLREGDVLLSINGVAATDWDRLAGMDDEPKVNDEIIYQVKRENGSEAALRLRISSPLNSRQIQVSTLTSLAVVLDVEGKRLRYTNAGHNFPVLMHEDGKEDRLAEGGVILGAFPESEYKQGEIHLRPGDRLVMFTDGVSEAANAEGEEFGEERLIEAVRSNRKLSAKMLRHSLVEAVTGFCGGEFADDATLLVVAIPDEPFPRGKQGEIVRSQRTGGAQCGRDCSLGFLGPYFHNQQSQEFRAQWRRSPSNMKTS